MNLRLFLFLVIALNVAFVTQALAYRSGIEVPTTQRVVELTTTELRSLDPHSHGPEDSVSDDHHGVMVTSDPITLTEDLWVYGIELEMVNAPKVTLHHLNVFRVFPITPLTPPGRDATYIGYGEVVSMGQETPSRLFFKKPYAVMLPKGTRLYISAMLHNPNPPKGPGDVYEHVAVKIRLTGNGYDPQRNQPLFIKRLILADADSKSGETFTVPSRTETYIKTGEGGPPDQETSYTFPYDATIIRMGAHLHPWEGGKEIDAYINGEPITSFIPRHNGPNPWDWHTDYYGSTVHVKKGDTISFSARYTNPGDEPIVGAMGMFSFRYAPDPIASPPSLFSTLFTN